MKPTSRTAGSTLCRTRLSGWPVLAVLIACGCSGSPTDGTDTAADAIEDVGTADLPDASQDVFRDTAGDIAVDESAPDNVDAVDAAPDVVENPVTVNVVPFVRLTATDTLHEAFPWPIEAKDAPATVRDGDPDTSWKIPAAEDTVLFVDVLPWLGRGADFVDVSGVFSGGYTAVRVDLADRCGGAILASVDWTDVTAVLPVGSVHAGCLEIHVAASEPAAFDDLVINAVVPAAAAAETPQPEAPPVPVRLSSGVIEGFYGVPWSWAERRRMVDVLSESGFGAYLYCPKWDPKHRAVWREPYTDQQVADFGAFIAYAADRKVVFSFGISPFIDFDDSDDQDYQTLKTKVEAFVEKGAGSVTLLADDIEFDTLHPIDAVMGAVHAQTANRLLEDIRKINPDVTMGFVPTVYSDERLASFESGSQYLHELAALDPDISILWTGPHTSDAVMTAADMDEFRAITGRKPLIWDNFWANDGGDGFLGRILLGPFSGREPELVDSVAGIMHNPSIQGALMRLTMSTFAEWFDSAERGSGYSETAAIERAASDEVAALFSWNDRTDFESDSLAFAMMLFFGNAQAAPGHPDVVSGVDAVIDSVNRSDDSWKQQVPGLVALFARMAAFGSEIYHSRVASDIADELFYPLQKTTYEGTAGLNALAALVDRAAGGNGKKWLDAADAAIWESNLRRFTFAEGRVEKLVDAVKSASGQGGGRAPISVAIPVAGCEAGRRLVLNPSVSGSETYSLSVYGLPGAGTEGGFVTWTVPHAGRFVFTVVASDVDAPEVFGFATTEIECGYQSVTNK